MLVFFLGDVSRVEKGREVGWLVGLKFRVGGRCCSCYRRRRRRRLWRRCRLLAGYICASAIHSVSMIKSVCFLFLTFFSPAMCFIPTCQTEQTPALLAGRSARIPARTLNADRPPRVGAVCTPELATTWMTWRDPGIALVIDKTLPAWGYVAVQCGDAEAMSCRGTDSHGQEGRRKGSEEVRIRRCLACHTRLDKQQLGTRQQKALETTNRASYWGQHRKNLYLLI